MGKAHYDIVGSTDQWSIDHDGRTEGDYSTKEAAFEATCAAASNAIKFGHEIRITVPASEVGGTALGAKTN